MLFLCVLGQLYHWLADEIRELFGHFFKLFHSVLLLEKRNAPFLVELTSLVQIQINTQPELKSSSSGFYMRVKVQRCANINQRERVQ